MENKFILGDCMDKETGLPSYPDNHFDLAIVDPPYGIGVDGQSESTSKHGGRRAIEFKGWDNTPPDASYFSELFRVSKNQIIWGANYYPQHLPPSMGWIFWDKGQRICNSDGELAFSSFSRALRVATINRVYIQEFGGGTHPTQKPYRLYRWLAENYASPGDLICDTHTGSASSLIAYESLGFNYVAWEKDPDYYAAAKNRMSKGIQKDIFSQ
jgi:site-specific DNA-methyltransferase (adenine-specific)